MPSFETTWPDFLFFENIVLKTVKLKSAIAKGRWKKNYWLNFKIFWGNSRMSPQIFQQHAQLQQQDQEANDFKTASVLSVIFQNLTSHRLFWNFSAIQNILIEWSFLAKTYFTELNAGYVKNWCWQFCNSILLQMVKP